MELYYNEDKNWVQLETKKKIELIKTIELLIKKKLHFSFYSDRSRYILKLLIIDFYEIEDLIKIEDPFK